MQELGEVIYEQTTPGAFSGHFLEINFCGIQILRSQTNQAVHQAGLMHPDYRVLGIPVAMDGVVGFRGHPATLGSIIATGGGSEVDILAPKNLDFLALSIPGARLARYAHDAERCEVEREANDAEVLRPGESRLAAFRGTIMSIMEAVAQTPSLLAHTAIQAGLEHAVLSAVADVTAQASQLRVAPSLRHAIVARAREYMRAHRDAPLTVEDLCRAIGTSRRTLQYSFQEVLQTTPLAYLRAIRLNGARRMLRSAEAHQRTVQDVAAHWGFWHLSHFAAYYRSMFGEPPSQTLQRAQRLHRDAGATGTHTIRSLRDS